MIARFSMPYPSAQLLIICFFLFSVTLSAQLTDTVQIEKQVDDLNNTASQMLRQRKYEEALTTAQQAVDLSQNKLGKENSRYATAMNWLGGAYFNLRQMDKAEACYKDAIDWRVKTVGKNHRDYARPVYNLAMLYLNTGEFDQAEPLFLESQRVIVGLSGDRSPDYAIPSNGLATLYMRMGKFTKAEPLNRAIIEIREKTVGKMHPDYAQAIYNLGILYLAEVRYGEAEPLLQEAKDIQKAITGTEHPDYAKYLGGLANLYTMLGNWNKVESMYLETLAIQEKTLGPNHPEYVMMLNNLAVLYNQVNKLTASEQTFNRVFELAPGALSETHPLYALLLGSRANLYLSFNDNKQAEIYFQKALDIIEKAVGIQHPHYATTLNQLAYTYYIQSDFAKSTALFEQARQIQYDVLGKNNQEYNLYSLNLGMSLFHTQKDEAAEKEFLDGIALCRSLILASAGTFSESQLLSYLEPYQSSLDVINTFAHLKQNPSITGECYNNALFFKGFLLENNRYLTESVEHTDSATIEEFNLWQSYRRRLAQEYAKPFNERQKVQELENDAETIEKSLIRKLPALSDSRRLINWQDVQARLPEGTAAIEFVRYHFYRKPFFDSTLYAAIVLLPGASGPAFVPLCDENALLRNLEKNKDVAYWSGGESSLYNLLWRPLAAYLSGVQTVYYSPDGLIFNFNLDAIALDPSGNTTLIDQYNLIRLGSTRQLAMPAPSTISQANTALLFGGIRYEASGNEIIQKNKENGLVYRGENHQLLALLQEDSTKEVPDLQYLPGTLKEVDFIENQLRKSFKTEVFTGYSASEEAFKFKIISAQSSPRIIHIATHGFSTNPAENLNSRTGIQVEVQPVRAKVHPFFRSGLYFAGADHARKTGTPIENGMEDGILSAYEVSTLSLRQTELVVLSACKTGLGSVYGRDGLYGLQRAFKIAGARFLVLSLWQVPDNATEDLMSAFYTNWLNQKMDIPTAFRQAQLAMKKKYKDPEMWAGFVLVE